MLGVGCWFLGAGTQGTLFPWLITVVLAEDAFRVGAAQTLAMLPALLLILVGGAYADRHDGRRVLIALHCLACVPPLVLAAALSAGHQSYSAILAYAVAMGALTAFIVPARDSLLSRVAGTDLQRTVTLTILLQTIAQVVGTAIAGTAAALGAPGVLFCQAIANLAGAFASWRLLPAPPSSSAPSRGQLAEIGAGLRELVETRRLLTVTLLAVSIGVLFLGPFLVGLPLMVRDLYAGSAPEIAGINAAMMLGMLTGAGGLLARGGVRRQGRAVLVSLLAGATALLGVSFGPPLPVVYGLVFLFGVGGGVATPAGRTLVQEAAPESHRARILSAYSMGFMGAAPIGAFAAGLLAEAFGPLTAIAVPAASMGMVIALTLFASDAWHWESGSQYDA
jgi:MFS family permease